MAGFIIWILQTLLVPLTAPLLIGIIRKLKAKLQHRQGASILQPYYDLRKLFHKSEIISEDASWIFRWMPYISFGITIIISASIPVVTAFFPHHLLGDFLLVVYLFALSTFLLALAGMDSGSAFGGFGSSREMTIAALAEGALIFSLLVVAIFAGTTNLFGMAAAVSEHFTIAYTSLTLAFIAYLIAMLAENARFPFDNPSTHLELTMVHEAMILEYSGKRLALVEWSSANKLLIFCTLGANIFFPWGLHLQLGVGALLINLGLWAVKVLIIAVFIAVMESTIAKYRYFRLPDFLFAAFILGVIALTFIL